VKTHGRREQMKFILPTFWDLHIHLEAITWVSLAEKKQKVEIFNGIPLKFENCIP